MKKNEAVTDNPSIRIYINKIENRITFKIKTGYYPKLLMLETIKLLGNTKSKINKDENGEVYIEVLLNDQNSKPLEIEDKIIITLVINQSTRENDKIFSSIFCKRLWVFAFC